MQYAKRIEGLFVQFDILETEKRKNSKAKIEANSRYNKKTYKNIAIRVKPEQAEAIRAKAKAYNISIAQLIIKAVDDYKPENIGNTNKSV